MSEFGKWLNKRYSVKGLELTLYRIQEIKESQGFNLFFINALGANTDTIDDYMIPLGGGILTLENWLRFRLIRKEHKYTDCDSETLTLRVKTGTKAKLKEVAGKTGVSDFVRSLISKEIEEEC